MKFGRMPVLHCLRLLLFLSITWYYFYAVSNLFNYFDQTVKPQAKSGFLFTLTAAASGESYVSDFNTFYAAALMNKERLQKNLYVDVYDPFLFTQAMERISAPAKPQGTHIFQYLPITMALITPLAYFDLYTAWRFWFFGLVLCVSVTYLVIAWDALKTRPLLLCGLPICLTTFPISQNFILGQTTAIEVAIMAISFRFLIDKKYFWAGLIGGASILKLHQAPILLIPGFCVGKKPFLGGFVLMLIFESIISVCIGNYDLSHFVRTNFMSEITHSFSDMSDVWYFITFSGMLQCLPWFIASAAKIGEVVYALVLISSIALWLKFYPRLQRISDQSTELVAAITSIALIIFSPHGYWSDSILYLIPCLWLYIWSTSNDVAYSKAQAIIRFIISIVIFYVPFFFWENLSIQERAESTITWYQIRIFSLGITLLSCAMTAVFLEFRKSQTRVGM